MSSIYKKGRDGYFYYQTYVHNPVSKKKDKKVFHALRTKDLEEAKKKQIQLDVLYEKELSKNKKFNWIIINKWHITILIITLLTTSIYYIFSINTAEKNISQPQNNISKTNLKAPPADAVLEPISNDTLPKSTPNVKKEHISNVNQNLFKTNSESKTLEDEFAYPNYTIERIERLSSVFKQGKVYITLNANISDEIQHLLCKDVANQYNEFSNIIICLYANNSNGIELARGSKKIISSRNQGDYWLAMYSYNSVEGEYFDSDPSGYLGY